MRCQRCAEARKILRAMIAYPPKGSPRRTRRGYPSEVVYDQYTYERMVTSYRDAARLVLRALGGRP